MSKRRKIIEQNDRIYEHELIIRIEDNFSPCLCGIKRQINISKIEKSEANQMIFMH